MDENGQGDVVALVDANGTTVASYSSDAFGQLTSANENFGSGTTWTNPYRYDGRDGVRYDGETGLYWMSVRAYDPTLGRFLSRDPLGRVPLFFSDQPYVYGGNNPLINVDPSGQFMAMEGISNKQAHVMMKQMAKKAAKAPRVYVTRGCMKRNAHPTCAQIDNAKSIAHDTATRLYNAIGDFHIGEFISGFLALLSNFKKLPWWIPEGADKSSRRYCLGSTCGNSCSSNTTACCLCAF